jgi:hypothetical protein
MPSLPVALPLAFAAVALASPPLAAADPPASEPAAGCHCFRDRSYDPARPAAADPYILATTRSSTLAAVFGADKATLVRIAMTGTAADDLWVAYWAGARLDRDAQELLAARKRSGSWAAVFDGGDARRLGERFSEALSGGGPVAALAAVAVDDVAVTHLRAAPDLVRVTRDAGAGSPELILSLVLAPRLRLGPPDILAAVRIGRSWGALLTEAVIAPADIDDVVKGLVTRPSGQSWLLR